MPVISGPELDKMADELAVWYTDTLLWLMEAMEEGGYPYGSVRLTPAEQLMRHMSMTPEDWQGMVASLERRYQGFPNQAKLVEQALTRYVKRMELFRSKVYGYPGVQVPV